MTESAVFVWCIITLIMGFVALGFVGSLFRIKNELSQGVFVPTKCKGAEELEKRLIDVWAVILILVLHSLIAPILIFILGINDGACDLKIVAVLFTVSVVMGLILRKLKKLS